jgi:hypothetical protein
VDDTFKNFRYVLYSLLTLASRIKAARGEEDIVFNAQGGLTVKALDQRNEKSISAVDWHTAACATEEHICFHGEARAAAFAMHHKLVMDLGRSHNWEIAMEYDIQQHEVAALNPSHNLSSLDLAALTIIATRPVVHNLQSSAFIFAKTGPRLREFILSPQKAPVRSLLLLRRTRPFPSRVQSRCHHIRQAYS